jgi:hypothetical protein
MPARLLEDADLLGVGRRNHFRTVGFVAEGHIGHHAQVKVLLALHVPAGTEHIFPVSGHFELLGECQDHGLHVHGHLLAENLDGFDQGAAAGCRMGNTFGATEGWAPGNSQRSR